MIIAVVYQHLQEKMKVPWVKDLPQHTVHVEDLCRAIVIASQAEAGSVYNVADLGDTRNQTITALLESIFRVKVDYLNAALRKLASSAAEMVCEQANEKHMTPWSELCAEQGVNTSLSPFLELEDMKGLPIALDTTKIRALGWTPAFPTLTKAALLQQVQLLVETGAWPQVRVFS